MRGVVQLVAVILTVAVCHCSAQTGVCYRPVSSRTAAVSMSTEPYVQQYGCGLFNWARCTRTQYRRVSRTVYNRVYSSQFGCCAGYRDSGGNRCIPVCSPACVNGGTCTAPNRCSCQTGWTGSTCGTDINECQNPSLNNCQQLCINTPGLYRCSCGTGYTLSTNGRSCINNDECMLGTDRCTQTCHDTPGSYTCSCRAGYSLNSDGFTCNDIDECAASSTNDCQQNCHNTVGSYTCSCNSGYTLDSNGRTCTDINECSTNNGGCEQRCINRAGSYSCGCNAGYSLDSDQRGCSDVNECLNASSCDHNCQNTDGSFECSCRTGYTLDRNGRTCNDNDECVSSSTNNCQQVCTNTPGSFVCSCRSGYVLNTDGATCSDHNECAARTHGCAQICHNTVGSYTCSCNNGYVLNRDGRGCDDEDECTTGTARCSHMCMNLPGGYRCSCRPGFRLNSDTFTCTDINECAEGTALCTHNCHNTEGNYTCSCRPGFIIDENGYTCDDVNECGGAQHGCEMVCNNTVGSFHCACRTGYTLNGDQRTCRDVDECATGVDECDQTCHNNVGSYTCSCGDGYTLNSDGFRCDDVNECLSGRIGNTTCLEVCVNTPGSWQCDCNPGYTLNADGASCRDVNECEGMNQCDHLCNNTVGSYTCSCNPNISVVLNPDGYRCDDIDECQIDLDTCDDICVNTYGTYECACSTGYDLNDDEETCADVNECDENICEHFCENTNGSYICSCDLGYVLTSNLMNCLGSPQDITFGDLESTTVIVLWGTPVNDSSDGNILSYTVDCSSETDRDFGLTMTVQASQERRVLLRNLRPYMVYNCCVSVRTDTAISPNSCAAQRTLEEEPNSPPRNVSIENDDPYSLTIDLAPPLVPNGVITAYTFYFTFDNGTSIIVVDRSLTGRFVLENLFPYQLVTIEVSANTSVGEGPKSDVDEIRTAETAPSMPTGLVVDVISNSSIVIRWDPPTRANGVLTNYTIIIHDIVNDSITEFNTLPTDARSVTADNLSPHVPYMIIITASTMPGEGEPASYTFYTEEGVPNIPTLSNVIRTNDTSARVFWIPLSLEDARGVLTSLQIAYELARNGTCTDIDEEDMQLMTITESVHTQSEAVIDGLLATEEYCVAIQVSTRAGESGYSDLLTLHLPSSIFVQIRLQLQGSCFEYIAGNSMQKSVDISSAIVRRLLSDCQCPYSLDYVTHSRLLCGSNDREVIYQSNLLNTDGAEATELREMVQTWVNTNPTISVGGVSQQVSSYCQVEVSEIGSMECMAINPTTPTVVMATKQAVEVSIAVIAGAAAGGAGVLLLMILCIGILCCCCTKSKKRKILKMEDSHPLNKCDQNEMITISSHQAANSYIPTNFSNMDFDNPVYDDLIHEDPIYEEMKSKEDLEKEIKLEKEKEINFSDDDTYVYNELPGAKRNSDDTELPGEKRSSDDK